MNQLPKTFTLTFILLVLGTAVAATAGQTPVPSTIQSSPTELSAALGLAPAPAAPDALVLDPLANVRLTSCPLNCDEWLTRCRNSCRICGGISSFECDPVACTLTCECCP